jgi:hypothetical protein
MSTNPIFILRDGTRTNIGDPFVFKYNGIYYLYPSTNHQETGIYCYQSNNLLDWSFVGSVCDDPITKNAYAPEIVLFRGKFLLITSPGGNGHYLFTSESPTGPFIRVTENINHMIDGSFYFENNQLYVLRANHHGISISELNDHFELVNRVNLDAEMNAWTEGPNLFKRNGFYYLTYCGNHLFSDGYRVEYSVAKSLFGPYKKGIHNPLLISVHPNYKALGHSSVVIGPDLDSYFHVYHQLEFVNDIPYRHFCLDRLDFNGTILKQAITHTEVLSPKIPKLFSFDTEKEEDFSLQNGFWLSQNPCSDEFTIECNVWPSANQITLLIQQDHQQGYLIEIGRSSISLFSRLGNTKTKLYQKSNLLHENKWNALVFKQKTNLEVFFQNECLFHCPAMLQPYFGWHENNQSQIGFVAISEACYKDIPAIQHVPGLVFLDSPNKEFVGFGIDAFATILETIPLHQRIHGKGRYLLSLFLESNHVHRLHVEVNHQSFDCQIDTSKIDYPYMKMPCCEIELDGETALRIHAVEGVSKVIYAEFERLDYYEQEVNQKSDQESESVALTNPKHWIHSVSVHLTIKHRLSSSRYGLLMNVKEFSQHPAQCHFPMLGYFIGFYQNLLVVDRLSYGVTRIYDIPFDQTKSDYHLSATLKDGVIAVFVDNMKRFECTDPHMYYTGQNGFYQNQSCWIEFDSFIGGKKNA